MSECEQTSRVGAYYDGELPAAERAAMERHVAGCAACAGELARLRALSALLGQAAVGEEVSARAMKRFHATAAQAAAGPMWRLVRAVTATAAAVLVGCGAALWVLAQARGGSEAMPVWEVSMVQRSAEGAGSVEEQTAAWVVEDLSQENAHEPK
ncbi:MAG: zf-HC2 domain-containing protein [Planctomycetota bacterium]|nr:zf-HC2 domain-containing protein [Planctomycetota bacterium]